MTIGPAREAKLMPMAAVPLAGRVIVDGLAASPRNIVPPELAVAPLKPLATNLIELPLVGMDTGPLNVRELTVSPAVLSMAKPLDMRMGLPSVWKPIGRMCWLAPLLKTIVPVPSGPL